MTQQAAKSIDEVLREEIADVRRRREVHGQPNPTDPHRKRNSEDEPSGLTGLALSGGGVRSAAFCLGFIQGMYTAGRMKAFDFLSTVSGGGYAGALFSSEVAKQTSEINWERGEQLGRLELERERDGSQSDKISQLSMHGRMMGNFLRLFSRHLWGFLVNVTFALSGVVAIAAVLAYIGRLAWDNRISPYLIELKFNTDLTLPFFLSFIALLIWLFSHFVAYIAKLLKRRVPSITQYSYLFLMLSVLLGAITVLALGDISVNSLITTQNLDPSLNNRINNITSWITVALGGLLAATLLPYLSPHRLLQSGAAEASAGQQIIFNTAGKVLLIGAPLCIFYFLVHENISGEKTERQNSDQFVNPHIQFADRLIPRLEAQAIGNDEAQKQLAVRLLAAIHDQDVRTVEGSIKNEFNTDRNGDTDVEELLKKLGARRDDDKNIGFTKRWVQGFASAAGIDDAFSKRVKRLFEIQSHHASIVKRLNEDCLSDPFLFVGLSKSPAAKADTATENDATSEELLAFLKLDKRSDKEKLIEAIETLRSARLQFSKRYADDVAIPAEWSMEQLPITMMQIAKNNAKRSRKVAKSTARADEKDALVTGAYVTKLQNLLRNEDGFYNLIENQVVESRKPKDPNKEKGEQAEPLNQKAPASGGVDVAAEKREFSFTNAQEDELEVQRKHHQLIVDDLARQIRENNWRLLNAMYPEYIRPQDTTFAYVVNEKDQAFRVRIFFMSVLIFLTIGLLSNLNTTSLHGVYRDQLAEIWLADPKMKLTELDTCRWGAPYHLINCTVNRMGHRSDPDVEGKSRFVLSHRFCGTKKIGYRETPDYQDGDTELSDAVAISGAAVTSISAPTFLHQLVLFLTNFRLGQWLPNTQTYLTDYYWPSHLRCLANSLWYPEQRSYLFVSDGGHLDNSGLSALLERRCKFMVCVDAAHDPDYKFKDLMKVLHAARAKYGITVRAISPGGEDLPATEWLKPVMPNEQGISKSHFVVFEIQYPDDPVPVILVYSKLSVTDDEPIELVELARTDEHFPQDPTSNQFLTPDVFDAYFTLGRCVAQELDEFVLAGGLDEFNLPLGWSSAGETVAAAGASSKAEDTARQPTTDSHAGLKKLQADLQDKGFDQQGIEVATKAFQDWFDSAASSETGNLDSSIVDVVTSWVKTVGLDAPAAQRRDFCRTVSKLVKDNIDIVRNNKDVADDFSVILSILGGRSKSTLDLLKNLMVPSAANPNAT